MPFKKIKLPNTNLLLTGVGTDTNGNRVVRVSFPNSRSFSIQLVGALPNTTSILGGLTDEDIQNISPSNLLKISREIADYIVRFGSANQRKQIRIY